MQVLKHGNHHWEFTATCYCCDANLQVSGGDLFREPVDSTSRYYFICPECNRRNYYEDAAKIPAEVRSNARKDFNSSRRGCSCRSS